MVTYWSAWVRPSARQKEIVTVTTLSRDKLLTSLARKAFDANTAQRRN